MTPARPSHLSLLAATLLIAALLGGCGGGGDTKTDKAKAPQKATSAPTLADVPAVARRLEPSVVAVLVKTPQGGAEGSGVVYRKDTIVTHNHVVENARAVTVVLASGERIDAKVRATDPRTDIALLTVEGRDLSPVTFAKHIPEVGSLAIAMGNPLGFEGSVTAGIVSGVDREIPSGGRTPSLVGLIQTDAAISPGNSGGALVDGDGTVIGLNVAYIPPQAHAVSIGFAIPAPTVTGIVEQLMANGKAQHAYLGTRLRPLTQPIAQQLGLDSTAGALVVGVEDGSPADKAGVKPGDVIVKLAGRKVAIVEDVISALRGASPGEAVDMQVVRDGKRQTLSVRPGSR
jgi:S1-C subfamily serine protease